MCVSCIFNLYAFTVSHLVTLSELGPGLPPAKSGPEVKTTYLNSFTNQNEQQIGSKDTKDPTMPNKCTTLFYDSRWPVFGNVM